ncbi:maleylpyruvate isomerase family mycothiol-dependent enzyme [Streptomyces sp. NBC_00503]|uniref:maleylpyruvate isomerase family mycothiol-dependent enzyme n=1 Tax=Streptomyces sp. NBC_00503 TaxID=2903659 RepID=UPI002E808683|nr:maleylpyruvate isomerase family mycothiol-dependent enzyme [Streptomyces sp. NBC_00503]WUD79826.1 maleylpyruvate isomerase family mycothiol-dependent enzyme [Streptomyces sp. NBC_00503]
MTGTVRMNPDDVWRTIDSERLSLADLLDDLSPAEWEAPSLCAGWRVRDVVAHLTLAHLGLFPALVATVRARGSFDRMIHDTAVRESVRPVPEYAPRLRAMAGSRRKAPGVTLLEPMLDILVHGQDITVPLGRTRPMPTDAAATAAQRAWSMGFPFHARRRLAGFRLAATDCDWSVAGSGGDRDPVVEGPVSALLLLVTGRHSAALPLLSGPGLPALGERLGGTKAPRT